VDHKCWAHQGLIATYGIGLLEHIFIILHVIFGTSGFYQDSEQYWHKVRVHAADNIRIRGKRDVLGE